MSVHRRLLLLVFSVLVPAVLACGVAVAFAYSLERQRSEENLLRTAQALAESLDDTLGAIGRQLEMLAVSPALQRKDLATFWSYARRAVKDPSMWIVLTEPDGQQVVNTLREFGEPLPRHGADNPFMGDLRQVFATRRPLASDLFPGALTGAPTLAVTVPVTDDNGQVMYALSMGMTPRALHGVVSSVGLPSQWLTTAFDRRLAIVARSRNAEQYIGHSPTPEFAAMLRSVEAGLMEGRSLDGQAVRVAFSRSPILGWYFSIGVPTSELAQAIWRTVALVACLTTALLAAGLGIAWRIGRKLSLSIRSLVPIALRPIGTKLVAPRKTGVWEVDRVAAALFEANAAQQDAELEKDRAGKAIQAAKERAEEVLSSIADGFYALDRDWRFTYLNQRALQSLGVTLDRAVGTEFFTAFPQVRGTEIHANYERVMTERRAMQFDAVSPILHRWIAFSVYPAGDGGISVYFRDISRQKEAEAALVAAKERAEHADAAKSRFLAAASHDLRQPAQGLLLFLDGLRERIEGGSGSLHEMLRGAEQSASALKNVLDIMLDLSRLDAGTVKAKPEPVPLGDFLRQIHNEFQHLATIREIDLRMVPTRLVVNTDPALLGQILRNFVSNALRYTPKGGIVIGCRRHGDHVSITVVDTGIGVPYDALDTIFDEYVQLGNPERDREKGLGLGLAIVRRLGTLLDAPITVKSKVGHGSSFAVDVPIAAAPPPDPPAATVAANDDCKGFIVLIDDEPLVLGGMMALLEGWGYEVLAAASISDVVEKLERCGRRAPALIIADYRLQHGQTGADAIRRIHEISGVAAPSIVVTGDTAPERLREALASGYTIMNKPVSPGDLRDAIAQTIRGTRMG